VGRRIDHVGNRLAAEDERRRLECPRAGDPGVDDRGRSPLLEGASGLECRLDRPDAAAERVEPVEKREFPLGGGDDEHCGADPSAVRGSRA
jgi:hypothetical protein